MDFLGRLKNLHGDREKLIHPQGELPDFEIQRISTEDAKTFSLLSSRGDRVFS
jgi:DNA polymerase III alpha subunit